MSVAGRRRGRLLVLAVVVVVVVAGCGAWALRTESSAQRASSGCDLVVQVFLEQGVDAETRDGVELVIRHLPHVASYSYEAGATASFRIKPATGDVVEIMTMTGTLQEQGGVLRVSWEIAGVDTPSWAAADGPPEIILFLRQDIREDERIAVEQAIGADPGVAELRYVDPAESLAEFERLFAANQAMLDRVHENPELLPTSYRIVPTTADHAEIEATADRLGRIPGVMRATSVVEAIEPVQRTIDALGCG